MNDGEWHHVVLVHDGYTGNNISIYVDGVRRLLGALGNTINNTTTKIGAGFRGAIDDVRFWDIALTIDQIVTRKNLRLDGNEANLVRYYPMDHGIIGADNDNIAKIIDQTANTLDGTLEGFALTGTSSNWIAGRVYPTLYSDDDMDGFAGSTSWTCGSMAGYYFDNSDCNDGQVALGPDALEICGNNNDENCSGTSDENSLSLIFDGVDDEVNLGNTLGNFGTGDFTIEARIRTTEANDYILSKRPVCGCDNFWNLSVDGDGKIRMEMLEDISCGNGGSFAGTSVITDGNWHHVAFIRENSSTYLVVDGVVEGSARRTTNLNNSTDLLIGNNPCGGRFKGEIDEIRIWNVARPIGAIENMKDAVVNNTNSDLLAYFDFNTALAVGGNDNTGLTTLSDISGNGNNGILNNFDLSGTNSNYLNNPGTVLTWYADTDSDGFGDSNVTQESCSQPTGYVADNTDCNDSNMAINPGVAEISGNSVDDDCDGAIDETSSMQWILLDDDTNGSCTSTTDCCSNTFCFGLEYTPAATGDLAAYTSGFFVDCISGSNPLISNTSCSMTDNSSFTEDCGGTGTILINASGNNGSIPVVVGTPIIIHQICLSIPANTIATITEDVVTDISISIDLPSGGAIDEFPTFTSTTTSGNMPPQLTAGAINSCYNDIASAEAAAIAATIATDDCDDSVALTASISGTCSAVITVIGTDDCGLTSMVTYNTTIDNMAPTADALTDITGIKCISNVPAADINIVMNETDNCGGTVTVTHEGDTNNSGTGCAASPYVVTRTYRLIDGCGNTTDLIQMITVIDDVSPTADALTDITGIKCIADVPTADINIVMNEADNCGGIVTVTHESDTNNGGAGCAASPYVVTRTYRLTDACGNTTDLIQMITVIDDVSPTADALTDITGIKCIADVPAADTNLVINEADNCGGTVTVSHEGDTNNGGTGCTASPYIVTRTYRVTDACGNFTDLGQTITVIDDEAPVIIGSITASAIQGCDASAAPGAENSVSGLEGLTGNLEIMDGCTSDANLSVTHADVPSGSCPLTITRTYTIKDACDNSTTVDHIITVNDTTAPVLVLGSIDACYMTLPQAIAAAEGATTSSDNCSGSVTISSTSSGTCPTEIVVKGTDVCGNADSVSYSVVITNGVIPSENGGPVDMDSTIQVALDAIPPAILPEIVDVCGNVLAPSVPVVGGTYQTGDCTGIITYTYTYMDCTNTSFDWTFTYNLECQKINIKGLVEGAYEPEGDTLRTDYNNLHLLPGQDKLLSGNLSVIIAAPFTPFGHPYQEAPWNYTGNLGDTFGEQSSPDAPANVVEYPGHVFDWILVTIRENGIEVADNIFQCAGWLHKDGEISFPETCPDDFNINTSSEYYVVLEHRNHLAVMDTATVMDGGAYIDIDFSLEDSYAPIFRQGQIEIETGIFGMYGANTDQVLSRVSINSVDRTNWKIDQNKIGYYKGDVNQNVSTNSEDETKWKQNQNTTSGIKFD